MSIGGAVCLICGSLGSCAGSPPMAGVRAISTRQFRQAGDPAPAYRFGSNRRVYELRDGRQVLRYALNAPIPLLEALRQGQVDLESLSPALIEAVKQHGYPLDEPEDEMAKKVKRPPRDKMVKTAVTK